MPSHLVLKQQNPQSARWHSKAQRENWTRFNKERRSFQTRIYRIHSGMNVDNSVWSLEITAKIFSSLYYSKCLWSLKGRGNYATMNLHVKRCRLYRRRLLLSSTEYLEQLLLCWAFYVGNGLAILKSFQVLPLHSMSSGLHPLPSQRPKNSLKLLQILNTEAGWWRLYHLFNKEHQLQAVMWVCVKTELNRDIQEFLNLIAGP